jgi:hypothetical protein
MSFKKSYGNEEWAKNAQNQQTEHLHTFQSQLKLPFSEPPPNQKLSFLTKTSMIITMAARNKQNTSN